MSTSDVSIENAGNHEAIEAWNGPLFERFVEYREIVTTGLGGLGDAGIELLQPQPGERVLDIGCGFGDTTQALGRLVGAQGAAVGVDAAPRFIELAIAETLALGQPAEHVRFAVSDVQLVPFEEQFDCAFSRFGTMFFASPGAAMRNVRRALVPGGRMVMVVWRRREDNPWLYRAQQIVEQIVQRPETYDDPTCGPGPFSMANADTVSDILHYSGFTHISLERCDRPITMGADIDQAVDIVMALGPAGEILRLQGDRAEHLHAQVRAALEEGFAEFVNADGSVSAMALSWLVSAVAPD